MTRYAYVGLLFLCLNGAFAKEACTEGMIEQAPAPVTEEKEPACPPAMCADACVDIPASSQKTGETISLYPNPNKGFAYKLGFEGAVGSVQRFCYTIKSWSPVQQRSFSLCIQYRDE